MVKTAVEDLAKDVGINMDHDDDEVSSLTDPDSPSKGAPAEELRPHSRGWLVHEGKINAPLPLSIPVSLGFLHVFFVLFISSSRFVSLFGAEPWRIISNRQLYQSTLPYPSPRKLLCSFWYV